MNGSVSKVSSEDGENSIAISNEDENKTDGAKSHIDHGEILDPKRFTVRYSFGYGI